MALGKPVVVHLKPEVVEQAERAYGIEGAARPRDERVARGCAPPARGVAGAAARDRRREPRLRRAGARHRPDRRPPRRPLRSALAMLADQIKRLVKQSAIYGLGGIVSRLLAVAAAAAVHELPRHGRLRQDRDDRRADDGARRRAALGISSAFFRFYFDSTDEARRTLVVRTSFWFTMAMATAGLVAGCILATPIAHAAPARRRPVARARRLRRALGADELRAADVALPRRGAAGRVRQREHREHLHHRRRDRPPRRRARQGTTGAIVGNFLGTLTVYFVLLGVPPLPARPRVRPRSAARDEPLRDAARAGRARALGDQLRRPLLPRGVQGPGGGRRLLARGAHLLGDRLPHGRVPPRVARLRVLDRGRVASQSERTPSCSRICCSSAAGSRSCSACSRRGSCGCSRRTSPSSTAPRRRSASSRSPERAYAGYTVLAIGIGRARRTQFNWVVTGAARAAQRRAEPRADPALRDDGRRDLDRSPRTSRCSSG